MFKNIKKLKRGVRSEITHLKLQKKNHFVSYNNALSIVISAVLYI